MFLGSTVGFAATLKTNRKHRIKSISGTHKVKYSRAKRTAGHFQSLRTRQMLLILGIQDSRRPSLSRNLFNCSWKSSPGTGLDWFCRNLTVWDMWCLCVGPFMLSFVSISVSAAVIWSSKNHSYQFGPSFLTLI